MHRLLRTLVVYSALVVVASCSGGGGCSSCAGGAIQPIEGEYSISPNDNRIAHAIQLRLTDQGLTAIEAIAPDLFAGFLASGIDVPTTPGDMSGFYFNVCPSGPCHLNVALTSPPDPAPLDLSFATPNAIEAKIRVKINGDIVVEGCPHLGCDSSCNGWACISSTDTIHVDTSGADGTSDGRDYIGLMTEIAISRDTHAERLNYHRADLVSATGSGDAVQQTPGEEIQNTDVHCSSGALCFLVNLLTGTIVSQVSSQIGRAVAPIQAALAATSMPDPPGCPTGTTADSSGKCHYSDNSLVPRLLGTQGTGNLGSLLARITPGLMAHDSYDIAAGDPVNDAEVVNSGMSVDVFGIVSSDRHSRCVPMMTAPQMPNIPEFMTLRQNTIPGTTTEPDLGIGVSEDFLNNTMWNLWDSGMFCLGVNTRMSQMLATGLFTALPQLSALKNVIFPAMTSPAALILRPQQPPTVHIGGGTSITTDPLLMITFQQLAIDFYAWSEERYVRFLTLHTDLSIPMNLMVDADGLHPTLGMANATNATADNTQLLSATPQPTLGPLLSAILGTAVGMFAGSIPAVNLPTIPIPGSSGGTVGSIQIQIPSMGIQGVSEGSARYLGLFANLNYMSGHGMAAGAQLDTNATVERLPFDPHVYDFGPTFSLDQLPRVRVHMSSPNTFGHRVEYTYRVDDLTWSQWTTSDVVDVASPSFIAQGAHYIDVRARIVDTPATVDPDPARVHFTIDTTAPTFTVERHGDDLVVIAHDDVSARERLSYRIAFDNGASGEFGNVASAHIPEGARNWQIQVRDEAGNQVSNIGPVMQAQTIRGGPSPDATSGCGCSAPGRSSETTGIFATLVASLFALSLLRRRRTAAPAEHRNPAPTAPPANVPNAIAHEALSGRLAPRILFWSSLLLMFAGLGCNCGAHVNPMDAGVDTGTDANHTCPMSMRYCSAMGRCVAGSATCSMSCPPGQVATGMPLFNPMTCSWDTSAAADACNCVELQPLPEGEAGSHLHMSIGTDNSIWFSAYSEGDPRHQLPYGDLVVGTWDASMNKVDWTIVDGVPATGTITGSTHGWRHGISDAGDDVGRWNSLALDAMNHPRVSYWDTTHDQLKFAWFDGTNWSVGAVDTNGHNGRYSSLVLLPGGIPAIAYRATAADPSMAGAVVAQVRYAVAHNATPHAPSDWTVTTVTSSSTSCRASDCATGQACVQTSGQCAATGSGCSTACSAAQACVAGSCVAVYTSNWIEDYPPGIGLFNSLTLDASNHPHLAYYDRDRGNLMGTSLSGSTWDSPFVIDGEAPDGTDTGDRGMWASLVVTSDGVWHVAYVDAYAESVMYTTVTAGTPAASETVDDGYGIGTMQFTDGQHVIGDSLQLDIDSANNVRVAYHDATVGTLRVAQRGGMIWTVSVADMMNHTGYWANLRHGNLATFWRDLPNDVFGVRVFAVH